MEVTRYPPEPRDDEVVIKLSFTEARRLVTLTRDNETTVNAATGPGPHSLHTALLQVGVRPFESPELCSGRFYRIVDNFERPER